MKVARNRERYADPMNRRRRCARLFLAAAGAAVLWGLVAAQGETAGAASGQPAAELTVIAYGEQRLDLATGRTVLIDGGEVVDRRSGVRLQASWIAYADGREVEARGARLDGDLGSVEADVVRIDLAEGRVRAQGGVTWVRDAWRARAEAVWFDAGEAVAALLGGVVSETPEAGAAEVWIDLAAGRLLLLGPYRYVDGPWILAGDEEAVLQLDPIDDGASFDARSDADPAWRERVERLRALAFRDGPPGGP